MRKKRVIIILAGALSLLVLSLILAWANLPRLVAISPSPGSRGVAVDEPLRLTFSRPLRPETARNHLELTPAREGEFSWEGSSLLFKPSRPWPGGSLVEVSFTAGARAQGFLGLPLLRGQSWSFTIRQELLIYLWPAAGGADLYALDPSTGDITRLTDSQDLLDYSLGMAWRSILYSVMSRPGLSQIFRLDLPVAGEASAPPEMLLECSQAECRLPRLSPDGEWLAYERTALISGAEPGPTQVWLFSTVDRQSRLAGDPQHTTLHPAWSAKGWLAFYDNERQGFVVQEAAGNELAFLPNQGGEAGVWNPPGDVFLAADILVESPGLLGPLTTNHLFAHELDQAGVLLHSRDLTRDMDLDDASPVFSPDGERLVFGRQYLDNMRWTPGRQLWIAASDASQAHQLSDAPFYNHYDFAWSPDGKRLAFMRFDQDRLTDPPELWVIHADGRDPIQLVKGGFAPQWNP